MPEQQTEDRAAIVDEYGELSRKIADFKPTQKRFEVLAGKIRGWYASEPGDQAFEVEGKLYKVQVSECDNQRKISAIGKLFSFLGKTRFLEIASVTLTKFDALVPTAKRAEFTSEDRTGPRHLTPIAKQVVSIDAGRRKKGAKAA